jgi:hypothetical protein
VGCIVHPVALPVLNLPAPMSPVNFTHIPEQRPILNRKVWYSDPLSLYEHLHARRRHPVGRGSTIPLMAATVPYPVPERRVDVVSVGGQLETKQGNRCKEIKFERHRPLSLITGWRRSCERRETLLQPFYS